MRRPLIIVASLVVAAGAVAAVSVVLSALAASLLERDSELTEYGRLMRWRARLIDEGVHPSELVVPLYPDAAEWVHG